MSDVINLRQQRKAKVRSQKAKQGAQNRVSHGRTKGEKNAQKQEKERVERYLEGHKREDSEGEEG